jgi:hypothetical protein
LMMVSSSELAKTVIRSSASTTRLKVSVNAPTWQSNMNETSRQIIEVRKSPARYAWMALFPDESQIIETAFTLGAPFEMVKRQLEMLNPNYIVIEKLV